MSRRPQPEPEPIFDSEAERAEFEFHNSDEWVPVENMEEWKADLREAARRTLNGPRKRISIAVPERDLSKLKTKAAEKGMPYQTLINSILHEYVSR